jgi:hypothetical protein
MKLLKLALLITPATMVAADYDIDQLAFQLGTAMQHINSDKITLSNMLDNFTPAVNGSRNIEQARRFWDNYVAASRLAMDSVLMLQLFYFNYNNTKTTLSYGANCALDE